MRILLRGGTVLTLDRADRVLTGEESAQRQIVALLSARGFRVVPAANNDNVS